jgi:hypothetical protein
MIKQKNGIVDTGVIVVQGRVLLCFVLLWWCWAFEIRALHLLGRCSTTLAMSPDSLSRVLK